MISAAVAILQTAGLLYLMWFVYVGAIHVINRWDYLPMPAKVLGGGPAIAAYIFDVLLNWTLCTVLFLDWPRERTITDRLHRYQMRPGVRSKIARWVCQNLLNPFDADHC